jgi:hypothetical protein
MVNTLIQCGFRELEHEAGDVLNYVKRFVSSALGLFK